MSKVNQYLVQPAITGVIGAVAVKLLLGGDTPVSLFGMEVPLYLALGESIMVGAMLSQATQDYILPMLHQDSKQIVAESTFIGPLMVGGGLLLASHVLIGPASSMVSAAEIVAVGAAVQVGSQYLAPMVATL